MPKENLIQFKISVTNPELFNLRQAAANPRSLSPLDLTSASKNISVDFEDENSVSGEARSFVDFLFLDFFVSAHRSGLYNRQASLWEAIARITSGKIEPLKKGWIFSSAICPVDEITLMDSFERPIIIARLIRELPDDEPIKELSGYLNSLVKKMNKMRLTENYLQGAFIGSPGPVQSEFTESIKKLVGAHDPIAAYDSKLPQPAGIPLNLIEMNVQAEDKVEIKLIHPQLRKSSKMNN